MSTMEINNNIEQPNTIGNSAQFINDKPLSVYVPENEKVYHTNLRDSVAIRYQELLDGNRIAQENYVAMQEMKKENIIPIKQINDLWLSEPKKEGGFEKTKAAGRTAISLIQAPLTAVGTMYAKFDNTDWSGAFNRIKNIAGDIITADTIGEGLSAIKEVKGFSLDDFVDNEKVGVIFKEMNKINRTIMSEYGLDPTGYEGLGSDVSSGLTSVGLSVALRSPLAVASLFGLSAGIDTTDELMRDLDIDFDKAAKYGAVAGLTEGALEGFGFHKLIEAMHVSKLGARMAKSYMIEATQEGSQSIAGDIIRNLAGKNKDIEDILSDAGHSAFVGGLVGGLFGGASTADRLKKVGVSNPEVIINEFLNNDKVKKIAKEEGVKILKRQNSLVNFKNNNPDIMVKDIKNRIESGVFQKQMLDIRDSVRDTFSKIGATSEEQNIAAIAYQKLANIAYEETGVAPIDYFKQRQATIEESNIDKGSTTGQYVPDLGLIQLFKARNKTTLMHEFGHHISNEIKYLNKTVVGQTGSNLYIYDTLIDYIGKPGKNGEFKVSQEEQFADGFVKYLKEGVAPSNKVKELFNRISKLFKDIYEKNLSRNVDINNTARELYNEILTSPSMSREALKQTISKKLNDIKSLKDDKNIIAKTKEDIKKYQTKLTDIINDLNISDEDKSKFLNSIKDVNSEATLISVTKAVSRRAELYYDNSLKKAYKSDINKLLRRKTDNLSAEQKTVIENIKKYNKLTSEKAELVYSDLVKEDNTNENSIYRRVLESRINGESETSSSTYETILNDISNVIDTGKNLKELRDIEYQNKKDELKSKMLSGLNNKNKITNLLKIFDFWYGDLNSFNNTLFGKSVADSINISLLETKSEIAHYEFKKRLQDMWRNSYNLNDSGISMKKVEMDNDIVGTLTDINDKNISYDISRSMLLNIYNSIKNEKVRNSYEEKFGKIGDTGSQLNYILSNMTQEDIAFADSIVDYYSDVWEQANDASKKLFNQELPKIDFYVPLDSLFDNVENVNDYYNGSKTKPNFLKNRSNISNVKPNINAIDRMIGYDQELQFLTYVAEKQKMINDIAKSEDIKQQIIKNYGSKFYNSYAKRIEESSLKGAYNHMEEVTKVMSKYLGNWTLAKISLSSSVFVKQLPSTILFGDDIPYNKFYQYMGEGLFNPKEMIQFMTKNSEGFIPYRFSAGGADLVASAIETSGRNVSFSERQLYKKTKGVINPVQIKNFITILQRLGDTGAWVVGGYSRYKYLDRKSVV